MSTKQHTVAVIGGGPAGLMAAEVLAQAGVRVEVYDAMPSVGRKFLMAGKGGMNITHAEPFADFVTRYGARRANIEPLLRDFPPDVLREWIHGLGIDTFVGTSNRVFPTDMKAAPLLRAWLHRLRELGVHFHMRHRWCGWDAHGALRFATPEGERTAHAAAVVLALGGGSWPQLGSDGAWVPLLAQRGVDSRAVAPVQLRLRCAMERALPRALRGRTAQVRRRHFRRSAQTGRVRHHRTRHRGRLDLCTFRCAARRDRARRPCAILHLDLLPDWPLQRVQNEVSHPRGSRSLSSHLQSRLGLQGVKANLLREVLSAEQMHDTALLARTVKALPLRLIAPRPLREAISTRRRRDVRSRWMSI